jgi:hypothetical protein
MVGLRAESISGCVMVDELIRQQLHVRQGFGGGVHTALCPRGVFVPVIAGAFSAEQADSWQAMRHNRR